MSDVPESIGVSHRQRCWPPPLAHVGLALDTCLTHDCSVAGQERFFDDVSERYAGFDHHSFYSTPLLQVHEIWTLIS